MKPKEKALELFFKYEKEIRIYRQNGFEYDGRKTKNCCLIAVDEILNNGGLGTIMNEWWQEVKIEIEKL